MLDVTKKGDKQKKPWNNDGRREMPRGLVFHPGRIQAEEQGKGNYLADCG